MIDLKKLYKSFYYAFEGLYFVFRKDQNLRIHVVVAIVVLFFALFLKVSLIELAILFIAIAFVICLEIMNGALEQVVDLIVNEHRKEAKFAKDASAGMVLIAAFTSILVGICIFTPHLF